MFGSLIRISLILFPAILALVSPSFAAERIINFHSDITVHEDSTMTVRETITVKAEGDRIKRGIYRDFPASYEDRNGKTYTVGFSVISVQKNDRDEPFHISDLSNGQRVYIGRKEVLLKPGEYAYEITYRTDRQLGFFENFDELYWNVTGNGWDFRIEKASAEVHLPSDAGTRIISTAAYTGPQGSKGKDFRIEKRESGSVIFYTTRQLSGREGLTIALSWPKGYVHQGAGTVSRSSAGKPSGQNSAYGSIYAVAGLFILFAYYMVVWFRSGRDPEAGATVVRYTPPADMSPAVMRYISKMGYDDRSFASAVISMAVRGHLIIQEEDGEYILKKTGNPKDPLPVEEKKVFDHLFGADKEIRMIQRNHLYISGAIKELQSYLKQKYEKIYFVTNRSYFVTGLLLTAMLLIAGGFSMSKKVADSAPFIFICVWLTIWSTGVMALLTQVVRKWRLVLGRSNGRIRNMAGAVFITLFSLPFVGGEIAGLTMLGHFSSYLVVLFLALAMAVNYLFFHLLKAPTRAGRAVLDAVEGFRAFLSATEKDRLNLMNPPEKTPQLFEKYLPFALALDVEQQWAEQFSDVLAAAAISDAPNSYSPAWYHGSGWNPLSVSDFAGSFGSSLSDAVSSASSAPGSSSGSGGGGSSGGGGGGGGGGGW